MASPAAILRASKAVPGGAVATAPPQGVPGWSGSLSPLARELATPDSYRNAYGPFLPRPPQDFTQGAFGPFSPILPVPVDAPEDNGRAAPRREQYQTGWNLPTGEPGSEGIGKLASFATLRTLADLYSVARACIQLRKNEIRGIEWDIVPTKDAAKAMRGSPSQMRDFGERRGKALAFFRRPDPDYFSWASFIDDALEQMFVFDALSIYLAPKRGKGMGKGLLGSDLDCLQLIDGQTLRPLYDLHGAAPRPPAPALQQFLYGVPRSDLTTMMSGRDLEEAGLSGAQARAFRGDQLLYLPYTRRRWSPYGMAAVERALVPIMSGLQKQGWQLDYFKSGTVPAVYISPGDTAMTPNQIRELQDALNAVAGDPAFHHKIIVLPPGSKTMPQRDTQLADQFDEIVRVDTCMAFDVEPMELGISPKVSTTQSSGAANQMAKMAQQKVDRKSTGPILRYLASVNDHILRDLCRQDDMRFLFDGLEDEDDEATETGMVVQQVTSALRSIDEGREKLGLQPWGLKETQDPLLITPTGPVPLTAAVAQASAQAQTAQHLADNPPPRALPPGAPPQQARPATGAGGSEGNEGQSPGHEAAEAAQGEQQADARRGGTPASKAAAAELDALARHLREGRAITAWEPRHLPAVALATVSEDLAKGLTPDQAVAVTRAMLVKAGPQAQEPEGPQDAQDWPGWQYDLALAGMYTAEVTAAFTAATTAASALLAAWWKGTLAVTRDALVAMIRSEVAKKVGAVLAGLWREAWHLGSRSATAVATMSAPDWGSWQPGDVDAAALVSDSAGLRRLLAAHGVSVIAAVSDTGMGDLAQAIAEAVADGDSAGSLARRLPEILRVPQRAPMIARTEIARAVSAATRDTYRDMGVSRKEWLIAPEDACPVCKANAGAGAVPLDATFPDGSPCPPAHPWCRCVLLPSEVSGVDLTDPDAFAYTAAIEPHLAKVGPHGFIHGWIFVGIPAEGDRVYHPRHGHGTVIAHDGRTAHVAFDSGAHRAFHVEPDPQHARRLEEMPDEDIYRELMGRGEGEHYNRAVAEIDRRDAADRAGRAASLYAEHPQSDEDRNRVYHGLMDAGETSEDAWAHVHGTTTGQMRREAAIATLRQQGYRGDGFGQLARESFRDEVRRRTLDAEAATNGYMLSPEGNRKGVDPWSLFAGPESRARRYASPELREWWDANGRPTFGDWQGMLLGEGGASSPRGGDFYA
jgi:SPP1 gp7 family putative phage head morphogenesis protein